MNIKNILVCITQQKTCERLIKIAAELRDEYKGNLFVIHVVKNDLNFLDNAKEGEALEYLFGVSKSAGANLSVLKSDSIVSSIADFAVENQIDCIIMGVPPAEHKENKYYNELKKSLKHVDIRVIS